jgi:hypothetical protein
MKENRAQRLERILDAYGGRAYLSQILDEVREDGGLVYKLTAAVSELRDDLKLRTPALTVTCYKGKTASQNLYVKEPLLELFSKRAA